MLPFAELDATANVGPFLCGAGVLAAGYLWGLRLRHIATPAFWIPLIVARLLLLASAPAADVYRYIWEGEIQLHGFIPYCSPPSAPELAHLRNAVWEQVGHKDVSTIYPPATELGFAFLAVLSPSVAFFKSAFLIADLAVCWLLARRFGVRQALVYGWNPIVIYSAAGGGHFDSWFTLALAGGWLLWERRTQSKYAYLGSAALVGLGVAFKWLCLPVLGWMVWRLVRESGFAKAASALGAGLMPFAVCWIWVNGGVGHCSPFPVGFVSVARSAELLPALLSPLLPPAFKWSHNEIYLYIFLAVCVILILRARSFASMAQSTLIGAMIITPMFHAWYATMLVPFAVKNRSIGAIAFSLSSFTYFWLHYTAGQADGIWAQSIVEKVLLWAPLLLGLAWDRFRYRIS